MNCNLPPKVVARHGMTLIELTVVIVVLLALIGILAIGSKAWRNAANRTTCLMHLRNVQVAVRSYQHLRGYEFGAKPDKQYGTRDIARHLLEKGFITPGVYDQTQGLSPCAGGGTCHCEKPDTFPSPGDLYMKCSLAGPETHRPDPAFSAGW